MNANAIIYDTTAIYYSASGIGHINDRKIGSPGTVVLGQNIQLLRARVIQCLDCPVKLCYAASS